MIVGAHLSPLAVFALSESAIRAYRMAVGIAQSKLR